ncbi:MAG: ABC transporter ATP-binding protein [Lachnospiraceae bacterium]|nr:ABC transporter ATP-binding protein [Lachnospiraceae bacterium]
MPDDRKKILGCEDVSLGYDGRPVMEHLSFDVRQGDYLCVIGENGSGKSTLIKTLLGLIKPVKGKVILDKSIQNGYIGYLPQQTDIQKDFPATVEEVVMSGFLNRCGWRPFYNKREKQLAQNNMKKMNILEYRKRCYKELSGGQQQRVLIARALCAAGGLLILDEPVTGLDPNAMMELYESLEKLNKTDKMTIIMVSHDIKNVVEQASMILHINNDEYFYGDVNQYIYSEFGESFKLSREKN